MFRYRDKETARRIVERLKEMNARICVMHVCGTHQDTIVRHGLAMLFLKCGVDVRQGPGCPVCVTTTREFEEAIVLAKRGKTIATYGDAVRVPGVKGSLLDVRAEGYDVRVVYSVEDAVDMARREPQKDFVFMAVGFETTAPSTAATVVLNKPPKNFSILNCHRYIPPVLRALLDMGALKLQGLIEPGHVSTVIGLKPYLGISESYHIPQVVAGFEPLDMLMAVYMLARQIRKGDVKVENEYARAVRFEGNTKALRVIKEAFEPFDVEWRGFPIIPRSGMALKQKFEEYDARRIHEDEIAKVQHLGFDEPRGCRCGEILRGMVESKDCPLFGRECTPHHPVGPCMVSIEGSCSIEHKYGSARKTTV